MNTAHYTGNFQNSNQNRLLQFPNKKRWIILKKICYLYIIDIINNIKMSTDIIDDIKIY